MDALPAGVLALRVEAEDVPGPGPLDLRRLVGLRAAVVVGTPGAARATVSVAAGVRVEERRPCA